jgi:Ser/Thr protein kinase RdoA (MazF antagonist)
MSMSGPARMVLAVLRKRAAGGTYEAVSPELAKSLGMTLAELHQRLAELSRAHALKIERRQVGEHGVPVRFHFIETED